MVSFRILGVLEVGTPEGPVAIQGRHHPRLLAMLLAEANHVVPTERLAAALWEDGPPSTAARQVQNIAAALRRQLGPAGERLRSTGSGYRIDVEADELDLCSAASGANTRRWSIGRRGDWPKPKGRLKTRSPNGAGRPSPASPGGPSNGRRGGSTTTGSS